MHVICGIYKFSINGLRNSISPKYDVNKNIALRNFIITTHDDACRWTSTKWMQPPIAAISQNVFQAKLCPIYVYLINWVNKNQVFLFC